MILYFFNRFNFVSTSSHAHLIKLEFWEIKYRLMAFLILAESKLKSWIIKYGRRDSVELLLQSYIVSLPFSTLLSHKAKNLVCGSGDRLWIL